MSWYSENATNALKVRAYLNNNIMLHTMVYMMPCAMLHIGDGYGRGITYVITAKPRKRPKP
jgi:hypothetical protein